MTFMTLFYELIQVALGNRTTLSRSPLEAEWHDLYEMCQKQSVTGVAFEALENLNEQRQKLPLDLLYQWIGVAELIKQQNLRVNKRCVEISRMFTEAGFKTCILKGQGNARMYANPLARTSGDIDVWLMVLGQAKRQSRAQGERFSVEETRQRIDEFVHSRFPEIKGGKMHIEFPMFDDVAVEVHYIPRYMYAPKNDRRLQAFFREKAEEQFRNQVTLEGADGTCAVPTAEFNLVQQLSHMMSHVMGEGIGLRQFIDYYYVLRQFRDESLELGCARWAC